MFTTILFLSSCQITPLHVAAEGGRVGTVESLVAKGADINIKDDKGVSAEAELYHFFCLIVFFLVILLFFFWGGGAVASVKHEAHDTQILTCSRPYSETLA